MNNSAAEEQQAKPARIIPPEEHPILDKDIDPDALLILRRLRDAGHAGYLVGGGVRDLYLGKKPKDFDISTDAHPGQLRKLFRNSRTIGRRFRLVQVFFRHGKIIEVSTLRSQSEYDEQGEADQVLPANNTFGTLEEDAFRRDLTINSLFYEIEHRTVIDYVGGVQDLTDGIIRLVGEPERRIIRDPVRMLRAIRHAARTGFVIEAKTGEAIGRHLDKLALCPVSRIRDELLKDLQGGKSRPWAELAIAFGVFSTLLPVYGELFAGPEAEAAQTRLLSLLAVLDRLCGEESRAAVDDALLFALLLFPWAEQRFNLLHHEMKGREHQLVMHKLRAELDEAFAARLNLGGMMLDSITSLFGNASVFHKFGKNAKFPAWLQKKSYFAACRRFAACLNEATTGDPADISFFAQKPAPPPLAAEQRDKEEEAGSGSRSGGSSGPAFSSKPEGVFGLRREGKNLRLPLSQ